MTAARAEVLERIRRAMADRPQPGAVPREYHGAGWSEPDVELFAQRVADYRAAVHRVRSVARAVTHLGPERVVVPLGLPVEWLPADVPVVVDDPPLSVDRLDAPGAALTACALAIAETGTVVLDHGPAQGRRELTLVPDHHIVVVRVEQVVARVPDAIARLDPTRPQTWISGPSATSDIELSRVEGVHGPRRLDVLLCD
jgi:L-lactate dehydrogenase complex protein LldG